MKLSTSDQSLMQIILLGLIGIIVVLFASTSATAQRTLSSEQLRTLRIIQSTDNINAKSDDIIIKNVNVLVGNGDQFEAIDVLIRAGKIDDISYNIRARSNSIVIEGDGQWITPGLINTLEVELPLMSNDIGINGVPHTIDYLSNSDAYFNIALKSGITALQIIDSSTKQQIGQTLYTHPTNNIYNSYVSEQRSAYHYRCDENGPRTDQKVLIQFTQSDYYLAIANGDMPFILHCNSSDRLSHTLKLLNDLKIPYAGIVGTESYKLAKTIPANICLVSQGFIEDTALDFTRLAPIISFLRESYRGCTVVTSMQLNNFPYLHAILGKITASTRTIDRFRDLGELKVTNTISWITQKSAELYGFSASSGGISIGKSADIVMWSTSPEQAQAIVERVFIQGRLVYSNSVPTLLHDASKGRYNEN